VLRQVRKAPALGGGVAQGDAPDGIYWDAFVIVLVLDILFGQRSRMSPKVKQARKLLLGDIFRGRDI
jgi:hypothetical protein